MEKEILTKGLTKKFGNFLAVDNLNLEIERGEIFGLLGPNGGGKTTTIRMILGILKPQKGEIFVLGKKMPNLEVLSKIGYMPQESALYEDLTLIENLSLFGKIYDVLNLKEKIEEVLKFVGLENWKNELVLNLSGGMKKRASFAIALLPDPEILILDEPTVGIDPPLIISFWDYFKKLSQKGITILLTTHNMEEAMNCQRVGLMREGKLIALGPPKKLIEEFKANSLLEVFLKIK